MNPEDLYNMEPSQFKNKLDGYESEKQETQMLQAYYSFKIPYHTRDKKGFSFEDFTELLPWFDKVKKDSFNAQIEYRNEQYAAWKLEQDGKDH